MSGRQQSQVEAIIVQAHWTETFARTEKLKPVDHYLKQVRRAALRSQGDQGEAVAAMLDRRIARMARQQAKEEAK